METVEKFDDEAFDLHSVHVAKLGQQIRGEELADKFLVRRLSVWLALLVVNLHLRVDDSAAVVDRAKELLDDHSLHLEATHVTVVNHDGKGFAHHLQEHVPVEVSRQLREITKDHDHCMH